MTYMFCGLTSSSSSNKARKAVNKALGNTPKALHKDINAMIA